MSEILRLWTKSRQSELRKIPLRVVILAAHPDDETIGASAAIANLQDVHVVYLTDGAPRDPSYWSPDFQNASRQQYAQVRRHEALCALALAGVAASQAIALRAIDQQAIAELPRLTMDFTALLHRLCPDAVITHPYEGGHPDHDTAALVAALSVAQSPQGPELLEMTSYHGKPGWLVTGEFLHGENSKILRMRLSPEEQRRKQCMMAAYYSQKAVLSSFGSAYESLRAAPRYDFTRAPHPGKLWYERLGWPITGEQWRCHASLAPVDSGIAA